MPRAARRLAAIMFTDIVGFTTLAQRDEAAAVRLLEEHRALLLPAFTAYGGRVVKTLGDGFLVEFTSALESVRCAREIQAAVVRRNRSAGERPELMLRVGIHVGEVIDQGGDIVGDAVNVASRLEPLAPTGGICISQQVLDQVRNKMAENWEQLVAPHMKNVEFPVQAYRLAESAGGNPVPGGPTEPASYTRVAVLPFASMSPDPADEFFADGLTEELIVHLSTGTALRVVARTSVMPYKGVRKGIREIGRELGVGSILEGSVRRSSTTLRVAVQLIDAGTEEHLWASRFDREASDVLAIQDEIARCVSSVLQGKLVARIPPGLRNFRARPPFIPN
ncbi:MAG: adenylate/guanylate cyclase domain-containing protein [Thermoplasmata archaeon]|nr:adenylate/guanylate cyclase domain-containing protein [Thermoplasmata archaeon]